MPFVEYIEQPELMRSRDGSITAARFFKVWDAEPESIINDPTTIVNPSGARLPNYGDKHPTISEIIDTASPVLVYYTVSRQGVMLLVTAYYSNDQESTGFAMSFQRQAVTLPLLKREKVVQAGSAPRVFWRPSDREVFVSMGRVIMVRHFAKKSFKQGRIDELQDAITSQIGDLHALFVMPSNTTGGYAVVPPGTTSPVIPGQTPPNPPANPQPGPINQPSATRAVYYRFEGADIEIVNGAWVQAAYSWSFDPGIKKCDDEDGIIFPLSRSLLYANEEFAVCPYQWVEIAARHDAQPQDENPWKFSTAIQDYRRGTELDWLRLPGMAP